LLSKSRSSAWGCYVHALVELSTWPMCSTCSCVYKLVCMYVLFCGAGPKGLQRARGQPHQVAERPDRGAQRARVRGREGSARTPHAQSRVLFRTSFPGWLGPGQEVRGAHEQVGPVGAQPPRDLLWPQLRQHTPAQVKPTESRTQCAKGRQCAHLAVYVERPAHNFSLLCRRVRDARLAAQQKISCKRQACAPGLCSGSRARTR